MASSHLVSTSSLPLQSKQATLLGVFALEHDGSSPRPQRQQGKTAGRKRRRGGRGSVQSATALQAAGWPKWAEKWARRGRLVTANKWSLTPRRAPPLLLARRGSHCGAELERKRRGAFAVECPERPPRSDDGNFSGALAALAGHGVRRIR
jgi:hypothetical protein